MVLQVLTLHYERHSKYYGSEKGLFATATEEEKRLTMQLFTGIFDSLAQRVRNGIETKINNEKQRLICG